MRLRPRCLSGNDVGTRIVNEPCTVRHFNPRKRVGVDRVLFVYEIVQEEHVGHCSVNFVGGELFPKKTILKIMLFLA